MEDNKTWQLQILVLLVCQLFLTENNLTVMLVETKKLAFKDRHEITPMGRFMTTSASDDVVATVLAQYE
ncbi:hypothetical protein H7R52_03570 [Weissella confusa]|uniref:DUF7671 domain-containing protein n=1 Tax=Weissella confusa TaxID=1583 RepID=A0A923SMR6_WEICO|nr:hypothetical protein [Weissella confusa]